MPIAIPGVGVLRGEFQHTRSTCAEQDRRTTFACPGATRQVVGVIRLEETSLLVGMAITEQCPNDLNGIFRFAGAMIEGKPEHVEIWWTRSCAKTENKSSVADLIQHLGRLRHHARIAEYQPSNEDR